MCRRIAAVTLILQTDSVATTRLIRAEYRSICVDIDDRDPTRVALFHRQAEMCESWYADSIALRRWNVKNARNVYGWCVRLAELALSAKLDRAHS